MKSEYSIPGGSTRLPYELEMRDRYPSGFAPTKRDIQEKGRKINRFEEMAKQARRRESQERFQLFAEEQFNKAKERRFLEEQAQKETSIKALEGLQDLYDSFGVFGTKPSSYSANNDPDQVNQLQSYIQRNVASGAIDLKDIPEHFLGIKPKVVSTSKGFGPGTGQVFGGGIMRGNFATGVGRGDMLPPKPRMNDEYGMGFSRAALNREAVKQRRLRQREDMSRAF